MLHFLRCLPVALAVLIADGAPSWKGEVQAEASVIPPRHVRSPATFFVAPLVLPKICLPRYPAAAVPGAMTSLNVPSAMTGGAAGVFAPFGDRCDMPT